MARIPQYFAQTQGQFRKFSMNAPAQAFGDASGTQGLARGVDDLSRSLFAIGLDMAEKEATSYAQEQITSLQTRQLQNYQNMQTQPGDLNDFAKRYRTSFDQDADQTVEAAPNDYTKGLLKEKFTLLGGQMEQNASEFAQREKIVIARQNSEMAVDNIANAAYANPDNYGAYLNQSIDVLDNFMGTPSEKEEFKRGIAEKLSSSKIRAEIERNPARAIQLLNQPEYYKSMSNSKFIQLNSLAQSELQTRETSRLEGEISASVGEAINTGQGFMDPYDNKSRKAVDIYYAKQGFAEGLYKLDPMTAAVTGDIVEKTGVVPAQVRSTVRGMLATGNAEQQVYAANLLSSIQERAPQAMDRFEQKEIVKGSMISSYLRAGIDPKKAIEYANNEFDPLKKDVIDKRKDDLTDINKKYKDSRIVSLIEDAAEQEGKILDPTVPDAPEVRDRLVADYRAMFRANYLLSGDEDNAKENASREFSRTYGRTKADGYTTGGGRVMKYAPELYYSIPELSRDDNSAWMHNQLVESMNSVGIQSEEFNLVPDGTTQREASQGRPSYLVLYLNDKGEYTYAQDKDFNILRFNPDINKEIERIRKTPEQVAEEEKQLFNDTLKNATETYNRKRASNLFEQALEGKRERAAAREEEAANAPKPKTTQELVTELFDTALANKRRNQELRAIEDKNNKRMANVNARNKQIQASNTKQMAEDRRRGLDKGVGVPNVKAAVDSGVKASVQSIGSEIDSSKVIKKVQGDINSLEEKIKAQIKEEQQKPRKITPSDRILALRRRGE